MPLDKMPQVAVRLVSLYERAFTRWHCLLGDKGWPIRHGTSLNGEGVPFEYEYNERLTLIWGLLPVAPLTVIGIFAWPYLPWVFVLYALASAMIGIAWLHDVDRVRNLLTVRLPSSRLIETMIADPQSLPGVHRHTPEPWRTLFMGSPAKDFERGAMVLAWNLDWYLSAPRTHLRWTWIAMTAVLPITAAFTAAGYVVGSQTGRSGDLVLMGAFISIDYAVYLFLSTYAACTWRRMAFLDGLIRLLCQRYGLDRAV